MNNNTTGKSNFVFNKLSKSAVVNPRNKTKANQLDEMIHNVVSDHLAKIIEDGKIWQGKINQPPKTRPFIIEPFNSKDKTKTKAKGNNTSNTSGLGGDAHSLLGAKITAEPITSENSVAFEETMPVENSTINSPDTNIAEDTTAAKSSTVDIPYAEVENELLSLRETIREEIRAEIIKSEAEKYTAIINDLQQQKQFGQIIIDKISLITPSGEINEQISRICADAIATIAKKLYLVLPVNFEKIISDGLLRPLQTMYKSGKITLTSHPDRAALCTKILQSANVPANIRDNIEITISTSDAIDDCKLKWKDTKFEYNQEQIATEIGKILEELEMMQTSSSSAHSNS